jgi:putative CocE/NonD family hydrolase
MIVAGAHADAPLTLLAHGPKMTPLPRRIALALLATAVTSTFAFAQPPAVSADMVQNGTDIAAKWQAPTADYDYIRREVALPMRDGVKLHTVILIPKGAQGLPMLLERTPYNAGEFSKAAVPRLRNAVSTANREWVDDQYIIVHQDIRGKYGSQGKYVMTRPPVGALNPTKTDDTTDAWDTIDWLVKNVKESNQRVGMIGSSYDGWTVANALLGPHPALKVAAPQSPMIDGWMGDDWFHYGAFRQVNLDYFTGQTSKTGKGEPVPRAGMDDYQNFLDVGSAGAWAKRGGFEQLPFWNRLSAHPSYDAFWQGQALDRDVVARASKVPTMWLQGLWDQEDMYGAVMTWEKLKAKGLDNNHLVLGPWAHSQVNGKAESLGPLKFKGDTAADFRKDVLIPFFNTYLKDRTPATPLPAAMVYNAVDNRWDSFAQWPGTRTLTPMFLQADSGLAFTPAAAGEDSYVSDPAKPVPYIAPPIQFSDRSRWVNWLLQDQRFVSTRTDVLSYQTPVLTSAVTVQGAPFADIFAKTSGTDMDVVVKIIDVYPPTVPEQPEMGGYQLPVSQDIFRGRYRESFEKPTAIPAGVVQQYKFRLPTMNWVFKPGHRIMVQIQSSQFPLYDRNPQTFVPNIFFAKPADYQKATVSIMHGPDGASSVQLPVVAASTAIGAGK